VKPRETITSNLEWIRIAQLSPNADTDVDLSAWIPALFITQAYKQWWEEWKEHLFCRSALTYRGMIDPKYKIPENTVSFQPMLQFPYITFIFIGNLLPLSLIRSMIHHRQSAEAEGRSNSIHRAGSLVSVIMRQAWRL